MLIILVGDTDECASLCTATNKKLTTFFTKTNYISKCLDFQKELIDTITTSNFYLKLKETNENDMSAQVFWAVFYSSQRPSQISPTADFDDAAIPAPIFSMVGVITSLCKECFVMRHNIGHSNAQPDIQIQKVI